MSKQPCTITPLNGSSTDFRVEQPGQPSLEFTASDEGVQILQALAEAFRQGDAWLGCHKAKKVQLASTVGSSDPRYFELEHWVKADLAANTAWNELVVIQAVGQQRHRLVFCIADEDLALDVWDALGDVIEVCGVQ